MRSSSPARSGRGCSCSTIWRPGSRSSSVGQRPARRRVRICSAAGAAAAVSGKRSRSPPSSEVTAGPGLSFTDTAAGDLRQRTDLPGRRSQDGYQGLLSGDLVSYLRVEPGLALVAYSPLLGGGYVRRDKPILNQVVASASLATSRSTARRAGVPAWSNSTPSGPASRHRHHPADCRRPGPAAGEPPEATERLRRVRVPDRSGS
jgi:hypothetical protein